MVLVEARRHPRTHVGESLLPGVVPILDELGVLAEVEAAFERKSGSTHLRWGRTPRWDLWFEETEAYDHAWFVERSRFDAILFEAARRAGAEVRERAVATRLLWDGPRLQGARIADPAGGGETTVAARVTLDATGQAAVVARDLKLREPIPGLEHQAAWAHYRSRGRQPHPRARQALFAADRSHWLWHFPLGPETASVGVVRLDEDDKADKAERTRRFEAAVAGCEEIRAVLGPGAERVTEVRHERDWSYRMRQVAGPGYFLAGDAAGFLDPVLSQGVFLAMHAGWHVAGAAVRLVREGAEEAALVAEYETAHRALFDDLTRIVRFFYQQNLAKEDYFWESKEILVETAPRLDPQKAFLVLTSGLVRNLALDERRTADHRSRAARATGDDRPALDDADPDELGFLCLHLRHQDGPRPPSLFFLVEPRDPAAPSLFQTENWQLNCLAPRYDNDPISVPELAPALRQLASAVRRLDTEPGEPLAAFWRRARGPLMEAVRTLPAAVRLERVFGE